MSLRTGPLKVAIAQVAPKLGDLEANLHMILEHIDRAAGQGAELIVFPELSLTGYFLRDMVPEVAQRLDSPLIRRVAEAAQSRALVLGLVEHSARDRFYNSAVYIEGGEVCFVHRKVYLPTYGMFDEQRYFAAGDRIRAFDTRFGRVGLLVCEDFWHLSCATILGADEVDYVICISNSPVRAVTSKEFASADAWRTLARCYARSLTAIVMFANRVGYEEGVCFWGGSEVVGPDGQPVGQAGLFEPELLVVEIELKDLRFARVQTPLVRDEKLLLTIAELQRIKAAKYSS